MPVSSPIIATTSPVAATIVDFAGLKAAVTSSLGRSDVPTFVYDLVASDISRDLRLVEMKKRVSLSVDGEYSNLPSDFLEVSAFWIDANGTRFRMLSATDESANIRHVSGGQPCYYAVSNGEFRVMPTPDVSYTADLEYYARVTSFTADSDTNDVLTAYPDLYLYGSLYHAATWAKDPASAQYGASYMEVQRRVKPSDARRRFGSTLTPRRVRSL